MKLVTKGLIEETKDPSIVSLRGSQLNAESTSNKARAMTPRFPTEEEIEEQEKKLLLSFAFKNEEEIEKFKREMAFIISQEPIVERPSEQKFKSLKHEVRSKYRATFYFPF